MASLQEPDDAMLEPAHADRRLPVRASAVDLGEDDPLYVKTMRQGPPDRRRVSMRWFAGSILTGVFSAVLVGGALQAAVGPSETGIVRPQLRSPQPDGPGLTVAVGQKGDRVQPVAQSETTRRVIQVSTITRLNDRDLVKVKPFVHVRAGLSLPVAQEFADAVPKFNPLALFSEAVDEPSQEQAVAESLYTAEVDGEVSIKVTDFPGNGIRFDDQATLTDEEVALEIAQASPFLRDGTVQVASLAQIDPGRFEYIGGEAGGTAAAVLAIAAVPENVSLVEKSGTNADLDVEETIITVSEGDALTELLTRNGATNREASMIQTAMVTSFAFDFRAKQTLHVGLADIGDGRPRPVTVSLYNGDDHLASVSLSDEGGYLASDEPLGEDEEYEAASETIEVARTGTLPSIYAGIWRTALAMEVPRTLVEDMVRVFSFDVDFQAPLTYADKIEVLYSAPDEQETGEVLFTSVTLAGVQRRFYRFRTPDDGIVDYYDETGKSAKKFLMRKPMGSGRFRSKFGMRKHPILGRYKMHTGVDWSAPRGTPIMAAGNGTISYAGRKGGYGKHIKIRHANGYVTSYSHQTRFAKGIKRGVRVRQGQIIGYVGSTGLSTGPHLHYEVLVNKRFVDPMKIRLPRGRVLQGAVLQAFEAERDRIDALLEKDSGVRIAESGAN